MTTETEHAGAGALAERLEERSLQAPGEGPPVTLGDELRKNSASIAAALPRFIPVDRFIRVVLTEFRKNPQLYNCERSTTFGAIITAAQLGLEFGPLGQAYLVPFRSKKARELQCQLIVGYKGYIALARRSGDLSTLVARTVFEHDEFEFEYGLEEKLVHKPLLTGDAGRPVLYYAVARFKDGGHVLQVLTPSQVEERRKRSQAKDSGPWKTDYESMAWKSCVRAMARWLPLTVETARAYEADEAVIDMRGTDFIVDHPEGEALPMSTAERDEEEEGEEGLEGDPNAPVDTTATEGEDPFAQMRAEAEANAIKGGGE
jgi:recombination protein RecT